MAASQTHNDGVGFALIGPLQSNQALQRDWSFSSVIRTRSTSLNLCQHSLRLAQGLGHCPEYVVHGETPAKRHRRRHPTGRRGLRLIKECSRVELPVRDWMLVIRRSNDGSPRFIWALLAKIWRARSGVGDFVRWDEQRLEKGIALFWWRPMPARRLCSLGNAARAIGCLLDD